MRLLSSLRDAILWLSAMTEKMDPDTRPILLFDGVCNLCDASVRFIIDHDPAAQFVFASLQSDVGQQLAATHGVDADALDTLVLIEGGRAFVRSEAALRTVSRLDRPWSWLGYLRIVPRPFRDAVYRVVSRNRLRWFGQRDDCRIPTPDLQARFLST